MSDEDFERVLELRETNPGQLHRLFKAITNFPLDDVDSIQVIVRVKEMDKVEDMDQPEQPKKLELLATL